MLVFQLDDVEITLKKSKQNFPVLIENNCALCNQQMELYDNKVMRDNTMAAFPHCSCWHIACLSCVKDKKYAHCPFCLLPSPDIVNEEFYLQRLETIALDIAQNNVSSCDNVLKLYILRVTEMIHYLHLYENECFKMKKEDVPKDKRSKRRGGR